MITQLLITRADNDGWLAESKDGDPYRDPSRPGKLAGAFTSKADLLLWLDANLEHAEAAPAVEGQPENRVVLPNERGLARMFGVFHNLTKWELQEAGVILSGPSSDAEWEFFNKDVTTFLLKLPEERRESLSNLIAQKVSA